MTKPAQKKPDAKPPRPPHLHVEFPLDEAADDFPELREKLDDAAKTVSALRAQGLSNAEIAEKLGGLENQWNEEMVARYLDYFDHQKPTDSVK